MTDFITTQWGSQARPFRSYPKEELGFLLQQCRNVMTEIAEETGIQTFLTGGCLLGAVRNGSVIPHDFDIDLGFMVEEGHTKAVLETAKRLIAYLHSKSYIIFSESNGQFKAANYDSKFPLNFEFFAAWTCDGKVSHYFGIREQAIPEAVLPLSMVELEGIPFVAPCNPHRFVEALYGPNWRTPDPSFRFNLSAEDWKPFEFLFTNKNQFFWDKYYQAGTENADWIASPSQFAAYVGAHVQPGLKLLDVGCGNGRDSVFLAKLGLDVTCFDYSAAALERCKEAANLAGVELDCQMVRVSSFSQILEICERYRDAFDVVYASSFIDATDENTENNLLELAYGVLRKKGSLMVEYRSLESPAGADSLQRGKPRCRLVDQRDFEERARKTGFTVAYSIAGKGFATLQAEDPFTARTVLLKD